MDHLGCFAGMLMNQQPLTSLLSISHLLLWKYDFINFPSDCVNFWISFISVKGGMFALGAKYSDNEEKYLNLGAGISNTCHESYVRSGI